MSEGEGGAVSVERRAEEERSVDILGNINVTAGQPVGQQDKTLTLNFLEGSAKGEKRI